MKSLKYPLLLVLALLLASCVSLPKNTHSDAATKRVETGMGPEDMVLDTVSTDSARLLISCNDHRQRENAPNGDIYVMNLDADSVYAKKLPRVGEPEGLFFHPHGVDLVSDWGMKNHFLYVVSHDDKRGEHYIVKYRLFKDSLQFVDWYKDPLMHSPNSVAALPDGSFYASNDLGKRGNRWEAFWRLKKGSIVHCDKDGKWARVAGKLAYANGLSIVDNHYLYVSTTRQHKVFRYVLEYEGNLVDRTEIGKVNGGDNIRVAGEELVIPGHLRILAFVGHFKKETKFSPSVVYSLNPETQQRVVLYANDGKQISACSTALIYKGELYLSQVFQPFILKVPLNRTSN